MNHLHHHIYSQQEAAVAYALTAERLFGANDGFVDANPALIPIFVSQLFQSMEIAIKHASIASGLFTEQEARAKQMRSGHGIKQLAHLAVERLGGDPYEPILMAMSYFNTNSNSSQIVMQMICGDELEKTRESYASRRLGYTQVSDGDFAIINPVSCWIESVKQTAINLDGIINILSKWRCSSSKSKVFSIGIK